jgi:hypothetical protein
MGTGETGTAAGLGTEFLFLVWTTNSTPSLTSNMAQIWSPGNLSFTRKR